MGLIVYRGIMKEFKKGAWLMPKVYALLKKHPRGATIEEIAKALKVPKSTLYGPLAGATSGCSDPRIERRLKFGIYHYFVKPIGEGVVTDSDFMVNSWERSHQ